MKKLRGAVIAIMCLSGAAMCLSGAAASWGAEMTNLERFATQPPAADEALLRLTAALQNERGYCLDIPGFGVLSAGHAGWLMDWPLETHTCKIDIPKAHYFFVDQLISRVALEKQGQIRFSRFDRCAEIMRVGAGADSVVREDAWVLLAPCSDNRRQQFKLEANGEIHSALDPHKCLTVGSEAHEAGDRAPNEPWYQRALTVSKCSPAESERQKWRFAAPPANPAS